MTSSIPTTEVYPSPKSSSPQVSSTKTAATKTAATKTAATKTAATKTAAPKKFSAPTARRPVDHVFVLWGEHFFENTAVIFATMFREAGLCVKLIGIHGLQAAGRNRVSVQADLSVTAALDLAERACSIVMPCSAAALRRMSNDPRIHQLFQQAAGNGACFFIPPELSTTDSSLKALGVPPQLIIQYASEDDLMRFAQQLAPQLAAIVNTGDEQAETLARWVFAQRN